MPKRAINTLLANTSRARKRSVHPVKLNNLLCSNLLCDLRWRQQRIARAMFPGHREWFHYSTFICVLSKHQSALSVSESNNNCEECSTRFRFSNAWFKSEQIAFLERVQRLVLISLSWFDSETLQVLMNWLRNLHEGK